MADKPCKCLNDTGDGECTLTRRAHPIQEVVAHLRRRGRDLDCPGRRLPQQAESDPLRV